MFPTRRSSLSIAFALLTVVGAAGCKKKVPPPPPEDKVPVQQVESKLQITTVTPASFDEGKAIAAKVYGSAFAEGASVSIGSTAASSVRVIDPNTLEISAPAMAAGSYDLKVTQGTESAVLRNAIRVTGATAPTADCRSVSLYFAFDSAGLSADAKRAVDTRTTCYTGASSVRVAGHADERGTTDYNLALGQRRANAVKSYLTTTGVAGSKVKTVSYGEERPADRGHNEAAWAKNRRAEVTAE